MKQLRLFAIGGTHHGERIRVTEGWTFLEVPLLGAVDAEPPPLNEMTLPEPRPTDSYIVENIRFGRNREKMSFLMHTSFTDRPDDAHEAFIGMLIAKENEVQRSGDDAEMINLQQKVRHLQFDRDRLKGENMQLSARIMLPKITKDKP